MTEYLQRSFDLAFSNVLQSLHLWATLYLLTVLLSSIWYFVQVRAWPSADGNLLRALRSSSTTQPHGADRESHSSSPLYRYSVNGSPYEGFQVSLWTGAAFWLTQRSIRNLPRQAHQAAAGSIIVYFNPKHPERSLVVRPGWGSITILWSISFLVAGFYIWRWCI